MLGHCTVPAGLGGAAGQGTGCLHPGIAAGFCSSNLRSICLLVLNRCCPLQGQVVALQVPSMMCLHEKEELGSSESPAQPAHRGCGSLAQYPVEVREVGM